MTSNFSPSSNPGYMEQIVVAREWPPSGQLFESSGKVPEAPISPKKQSTASLLSSLPKWATRPSGTC